MDGPKFSNKFENMKETNFKIDLINVASAVSTNQLRNTSKGRTV